MSGFFLIFFLFFYFIVCHTGVLSNMCPIIGSDRIIIWKETIGRYHFFHYWFWRRNRCESIRITLKPWKQSWFPLGDNYTGWKSDCIFLLNRNEFDGPPPQDLSEARQVGRFFWKSPMRSGGTLFWGGGIHHSWWIEGNHFRIISDSTFFKGNAYYQARRSTGVISPSLRPLKDVEPPSQVLPHHRSWVQGRYGGTVPVPSVIVPVPCISYHSLRNSIIPIFKSHPVF